MTSTLGKELLKHIEQREPKLHNLIVCKGVKIEQRTIKSKMQKMKLKTIKIEEGSKRTDHEESKRK